MNLFPLLDPWLPVGFMAAEVAVVAVLLHIVLRLVSRPKWQKIICQTALLTVLLLIGCELLGLSNLLVARLGLKDFKRTAGIGNSAVMERKEAVSTPAPALAVADERAVTPEPVMHSATPINGIEASGTSTQPIESGPRTWANIFRGFCLAWVAGALVLAMRSGVGRLTPRLPGWRRIEIRTGELPQRVKTLAAKLGLHRRVRLIESGRLASPVAFGIFRPTVALPAQFASMHEPAKQDAILIHELAHLAGNDPAWHLLSEVATIILWWYPIAWWLRRQLQVTSELSADEASVLVEDGPGALAESLVSLGSKLVGRRWAGELPIAAFRSNLGCRVQRLLELEEKRTSQPNLAGAVLVRTLGATLAASLLILCMACLTPKETLKGKSTMKTPWKNSLFTVTFMTALQSIVTTHVIAQASPNGAATTATSTDPLSQLSEDDKFRMRYGLPPNGASAGQPAKQVAATRHDPATDREMRRRYGLLPASPSNNSASGDASELEAKLKRIVIDTVSFERLPLSEVIQSLSEAAAKNDPDRVGLNFLIHNNSPDGSAGRPSIDPATGLPLATTSEPLDVGSVLVNLSLPLRHVNLKEVLDAIVKVADHPIQYSVEEYAVVFSPRAESDSSIPALRPTALGARTFKVNTNTFVAGLQSAFGISVSYEKTDGAQKPNMKLALRQLLDELGIPAGSGRSIFYNEMTGMVMVRASEDEMRTLEAAMETLTGQSAGPLDQAKIGY